MVFGLTKKERKVPDLSRYDYYYRNQDDFNKSQYLSAAAASAAATRTTRPTSNNAPRSRSMVYQSNMFNTANDENVNPNRSSNRRVVSYIPSNNSNYRTYSLRSQNSTSYPNHKPKRVSSTMTRQTGNNPKLNNGNNKHSRNKRLSHSQINNIQNSNNNNSNNNNNTSNNTSRLNSLTSHNNRLNSITSNNSRNLRRINTNSNKNNTSMSRTNSITTKVTKVKDLQNRTTSITKRTIKIMDGKEIIETTTTTTKYLPTENNEIDNDGNNLLTNEQHFEQFSENFILNNNHLMDDELNENDGYTSNQNILSDQDNDLVTINSEELLDSQPITQNSSSFNDNDKNLNDLIQDDEYDMEPDFVPNDDDIIEEEEEEEQDYDDQINYNFQKPFNPTVVSNGNVPLDQTSSMSKFSDALESFNQSNDKLVESNNNNNTRSTNSMINTSNVKTQNQNPPRSRKTLIRHAPQTHTKNKPQTKKYVRVNAPVQPIQKAAPPIKKKPLTDQEMYLKALEVAKRKVYADNGAYHPELDSNGADNTRSQMVSRMSLRNTPSPAANTASNHFNNHNNNTNRNSILSSVIRKNKNYDDNLRNFDSSDDENDNKNVGQTAKKRLTSLFKSNKHKPKGSTSNTSFENNSSVASTPSLHQANIFGHSSNNPHSASLVDNSERNTASNVSIDKSNSKKPKLSDEEMYNKALELSQKRLAESHQLLLHRREIERKKELRQKEKEQKEAKNAQYSKKREMDMDMETALDNNVNDYTFTLPINNKNHDENLGNLDAFDNLELNDSNINDLKSDTTRKDAVHKKDGNNGTAGPDNQLKNAPSQTESRISGIGSEEQLDNNSTAEPQVPFIEDLVTKLPKVSESNENHKKLRLRPSRSSTKGAFDEQNQKALENAAKTKSKLKNIFHRVAKFSQQNSGYQTTKKEQVEINEQNEFSIQVQRQRQLSISEQQMNPPPLHKMNTLTSPHGASTTLPVEQPLDRYPAGIKPVLSSLPLQRESTVTTVATTATAVVVDQNPQVQTNNNNANIINTVNITESGNEAAAKDTSKSTTTSSIFSKNKRNVSSTVPESQQLDTASDVEPSTIPNDITLKDIQHAKLHKTPTANEKSKNSFFNKLFKRSKQPHY